MKTFKNCAAQGDLLIIRVDSIPENVTPLNAEKDVYVVAHSETGHHHVLDSEDVDCFKLDDMKSYIEVKNIIGAQLKHLRDFATHETILIPPGIYELRRQREYMPEGWRRVED